MPSVPVSVLRLVAIVSLVMALAVAPLPALGQERTTVVVLHTSDYHSHALPIYADSEFGMGVTMRDDKATCSSRPLA